ncbi:MAG: hypothetical protein O3C21_02330 [Verrucomicrobia bacterium]|nr:hypothetical protein [Verrucomicrobiota bacterium]
MNRRILTFLLVFGTFALGVFVERYLWDDDRPGAGNSHQQPNHYHGLPHSANSDSNADSNGDAEHGEAKSAQALDLASLRNEKSRQDMQRALHRATREQIVELAAGLGSLDSSIPNERELKLAILHRLADIDPKAALAAVLKEDTHQLQSEVIHHVFRQLARGDFAGAQLAASSLENRELRREAIRAIAHEVGSENPVAVAQFLESLEDGREFGDFFERWASKNPAEASSYVGNVEDAWKRREWTSGVARGWARGSDPAAALAWAKSLSSSRDRAMAVHGIAETLANSNPAAASLLLDELPADHTRRHFVENLARNWAEQDLEGAIHWAESLGGTLRSEALEALLPKWVRTNPTDAAAYVTALPASERNLHSMQRVAETWSRMDKDAALAWAASQENPAAKGRTLSGIAHALANENPQTASEMVALLDQSEERMDVLDQIARSWSGENLDQALGWIEALPPSDQSRAYRGLLDNVAELNPATAAAIYSELASSALDNDSGGGHTIAGMAGHIADRWSQYDPANAANWALSLPEGDTRHHAIERVADHWLRADPLEASQWIGQLDEGRARDVATERLVDQISGSDPDVALQWALTVQDEGHQTRVMHSLFERWNESDPAAAQRSFDAAPVSQEQRTRLENVFK